MAAEGQILCEHPCFIDRSHKQLPRTIYDWRHYLAVIQRKPGALRNGAPSTELPPAFRQLQDIMLRHPGGDREMVDILALVLHHDEQAVLAAVEMALTEGVATKTHVLTHFAQRDVVSFLELALSLQFFHPAKCRGTLKPATAPKLHRERSRTLLKAKRQQQSQCGLKKSNKIN